MAQLHNRVSRKELKEAIVKDSTPRTTISFYNYYPIPEPEQFRDYLYLNFKELTVLGRIYIATEGINAQISITSEKLNDFKNFIKSIPEFDKVHLNIAVDDNGKSFFVLDIKVRKKIVADGIEDESFNMQNKGKYVDAHEFNKLTENSETVVVDMRNHYEYEVGHFKGSIEIPSDTFRDQLPMAVSMLEEKKDATIIMYCTGGIRCEKASAYMLHNGFKNVFHLKGGIINYAQQIKENEIDNKFIGKNFVFDERLGERITPDIISNCHQCGKPCDTHVNCENSGCHLLFIQCEECAEKFHNCCSKACFDFIQLPVEEQKLLRKGIDKGKNIFNKTKRRS
jgi:UPF0176 protein